MYNNDKIFITGGTGFLGRGIVRHEQEAGWPDTLTIYSRDEWKQQQMRQRYPAGKHVRYILGDICDYNRLMLAMMGHDTVIHTAALKYIPEGEKFASECVRVNIDGSRMVMDAARAAGVKTVVLISTDKAPQPVNTYGMTKAVMERLVQETADQHSDTKFVACRYGNVIGSTGSIWPVWNKQYSTDKTITVTNPQMTRYFMSIGSAVSLIVAAARAPQSGLVVIPRPSSINIGDLAQAVADQLGAGLRVTGERPGEKLHEQMISEAEVKRLVSFDADYMALLPPGCVVDEEEHDAQFMLTSANPARVMTTSEWMTHAITSEDI